MGAEVRCRRYARVSVMAVTYSKPAQLCEVGVSGKRKCREMLFAASVDYQQNLPIPLCPGTEEISLKTMLEFHFILLSFLRKWNRS